MTIFLNEELLKFQDVPLPPRERKRGEQDENKSEQENQHGEQDEEEEEEEEERMRKEEEEERRKRSMIRFLKIAMNLHMDLQMILINRSQRSTDDSISLAHRLIAFSSLANIYLRRRHGPPF